MCSIDTNILQEYIDGSLVKSERLLLQEHLNSCENCRRELNQLKILDWDLRHMQVPQRRDFHFKLARNLAGEYATICIGDLNIKNMQRLWGKKMGDLSYSSFVNILKYQCSKTGPTVVEIPKFYPSSKTCSACGHVYEKLTLEDKNGLAQIVVACMTETGMLQ